MAKQATLEEWIRLAYEGCPPPESFLEEELAQLDVAARAELERHAESCAACAAERELSMAFGAGELEAGIGGDVDRVVRHLRRHPPHGRLRGRRGGFSWGSVLRMPAFQLAASALLLVGVGFGVRSYRPPALSDGLESAVTRSSSIELTLPVGDLAAPPVELAWKPVPGAASYRVAVLGVDEEELWAAEAKTAGIAVGAELESRLQPAVVYLWTVEAFDALGTRIAWSAPERFRIDPTEAE